MNVCAVLRQAKYRTSVLLLGCGTAVAAGQTSPLEAQVTQLRPFADVSFPTRFSFKDGTIHVRQKVGVTFGARMTLTFSELFDVVTTITYSPGSATLHGAGKRIELTSGPHSLGGATQARYWLIPPGDKFSWEVHTGVGMVFGGRPAYEELFENSTLSAVMGTALRYEIGRIVSLKLKIQERLLRLRFGAQDSGRQKSPLQVSFGLGLPLLEAVR
jgi:hypothetical protein